MLFISNYGFNLCGRDTMQVAGTDSMMIDFFRTWKSEAWFVGNWGVPIGTLESLRASEKKICPKIAP
jgi:hypothetical protein